MVFDDISSFYAKLEQDIIKGLERQAIEVQKQLRLNILEKVYGSYSPKVYQRTSLLLNSAQVKPIKRSNGSFEIEICIPDDVIHSNPRIFPNPDIGVAVGEYPSLAKVAEIFATGVAYGRGGAEIDVIKDTDEWVETANVLNKVLDYLRSQGFDVS